MSVRVDPNLMKELREFGLKDASKCFHCGNCTAVCPLSTPENPFPRKLVKYAQMGLKDKLLKSPEPWLCYYCGDCSDNCPRQADPGETMMVMRRYLTSQYDWTGFARRFYTSEKFEIFAIVVVALLVGLALLLFRAGNPNMEHAHLNSVWPAPAIEIADLIMAGVLTFFLLSNTYRCFSFIMGDLKSKIPLEHYLMEAKELVIHFLTQKKFSDCTDKMQWLVHLLIMTGYSTAFMLVVIFLAGGIHVVGLSWEKIMFQRDVIYPFFHPIRLLGYYATFALLYGTTYALIGRIKKSKAPYKNSHGTDWMFLILLQLTTLTGIIVHFTRLLDWPMATYVIYAIHLMIAVPMLVLEVPFAKWAHLAFRPVVVYLMAVKDRYEKSLKGAA
ncbi:MAG: 4Fe-4S dicluster domain-containing protein [Deltaproteobacteria bacterium]|nr:4Fe-4S dicluster domain-containing protein [Deltaproteobacteria bacterium]MBW2017302.1 4Fe-4S dicluster domain-containing protein [Deltaproteobacteria bacterium]MBW2129402.1 4Fe-4S dicluster domain-containing protein [Deltaproteobacteria bacterium]MBW2303574.1 4Fe-4S dicluster domain-containing protein [Deltaproteobacteria bacterium]